MLSYNQPKLGASARWESNAINFAQIDGTGIEPHAIFIDRDDSLYVSANNLDTIQKWAANSTLTAKFQVKTPQPSGLFVTVNGDVLVDGSGNGQIERFSASAGTSTVISAAISSCFDLVVDTNNTIYCSLEPDHLVISIVLDSTGNINGNRVEKIAGIGGAGPDANMLRYPRGIFVDTNFQLYVADCGNNRVQLFLFGQTTATTVAGNGAPGTIDLKCPSDVVLDGNGHIFIADLDYYRIVASGPNGFRCVIACTGVGGLESNQLGAPISLAFDSYGNIFVADAKRSVIQKFLLRDDTTGEHNFPFCIAESLCVTSMVIC